MRKKILFITPTLARTGSEMVLWYLLNKLDPEKYDMHVHCINKGELYDQLPPYISKSVSYKGSGNFFKKTFRGILKALKIDPISYQLKSIQQNIKAELWYVNTTAIPNACLAGKQVGAKVLTHFHELVYAFSFIKYKQMQQIVSNSDICVGCSDLVCDKIKELGHQNVKLQYSFIDENTIHTNAERVIKIKKSLGINSDDFIWVISGATTFMKGFDFIPEILEYFKEEKVKLLWLGKVMDDGLNYYIEKTVQVKYPGKLILAGNLSEDYYNYMAAADAFLLLSREESFSLVMIEAAYLHMPIVAFNTGVAKQFIKKDMGHVIEHYNISRLISSMESIQKQQFIKNNPVDNNLEFTAANQLPHFENLIEEIIH